MSNFNILSLLNFKPANFLCINCLGLLEINGIERDLETGQSISCPICGIKYIGTDVYPRLSCYLRDNNSQINHDDLIAHGETFADVVDQFNASKISPLRTLFLCLNNAKDFIHFTSWNITEQLIGALKIISQRVAVRGIVSGAKDWIIEELTTHKDEAPMFDVKTFSQGDWKNMPHQKIIVIDGLIAFKGSANLTVQGWRKSANGRDHVEVVTDVDEVIRLHNKLFAPVWSDFSSRGHEIIMGDELYDEVPF